MKRIIGLAVFVVLVCSTLQLRAAAPTEQGSWMIDGDVGLNAYLSGGSTYLYIQPSAMYFIQDRLAVGGQFILNSGGGSTTFGLIPSAVYTFGDRGAKGIPYVVGGLGIMTGSGYSNFLINLGGGYMSMLTRDVFLNFSGTFNITTGDASSTLFNLNGGVGVFL